MAASDEDSPVLPPLVDQRPKPQRRLTAEEWADLRRTRNYTAIFKAIRPQWTIAIERTRPSWCQGWCESIDHDPEEPIDLEYIRDQWGGQRFKLTLNDELGQYVTSFRVPIDGPPKRFGEIIESDEAIARREKREARELELAAIQRNPQQTAPAPAIDSSLISVFKDALKASTSAKDSQIDFLTDIVKEHFNRQPEKPRDLQDVLELAKSMREFMDTFGMGQGGSDDVWGSNAAKFLDILDGKQKLDERRKQLPGKGGKQGQRKIKLVKNLGSSNDSATRGLDRSAAGPHDTPAGSGAFAAPPGEESQLTNAELATTLAGMDATDAAAVFMGTLYQMEPKKRAQVVGMLMDEDPDELLDDDDDAGGDDEGNDEGTEQGSSEAAS